MRLFVGIDLDENLKGKVLEIQKELEPLCKFADLRLVERKNFHLTLKFLGDVQDNTVTEISERIKNTAENNQSFKISLSGLSFFGSGANIRVIFLSLAEGREKVIELERNLNQKLEDIRKEDFDPHPHLTLARVGFVLDRNKVVEKLKEMEKIEVGEMYVKEIKLFQSTLTKNGPGYSVVRSYDLK
ncbi:MAG TPA: RNA 2',3'-cyclic phosphodiesterase [archaeon]|nr:RNA 2',3'-cyclic phosphodiesterase [archaeon]